MRCGAAILLITLVLAARDLTAGLSNAEASGQGVSPLAQPGDWVRFRASFDNGPDADVAEGAAVPVQVRGEIRLEPGRNGAAIVLGAAGGGAQLTYAAPGNLDLSRPGGLSAWLANRSWMDAKALARARYVRIVRVPGARSTIFLVQRNYRVREDDREAFLSGVFGPRGAASFYAELDGGSKWQVGDWHLLVVTWDAVGFSVSVDGGPLVRTSVPGDILAERFDPRSGGEFLLGDSEEESWLLDDFTIYSRALSSRDVAVLYETAERR